MISKKYENWDRENFIKEIEKLREKRKYGLTWEDQTEDVAELCKIKIPVLVESKEMQIKAAGNNIDHILIEGDNYHALSVLNYTHKGRIDLIYIDPPYNTGNDKEWKFNDKFVNSEDAYKHSKWLSFMSKRIQLSFDLLSSEGAMFISIDDNEQGHLKLLCDQIFQERNVETYVWNVKDGSEGGMPKTAKGTVRKEHEYLIVCFKDKGSVQFNKYMDFPYLDKEDWNNPDDDPRGPWMSGNFSRGRDGKPGSNFYTITTPTGTEYTRNWSIPEDVFLKLRKDNRIYFSKNGNGVPRIKVFQNEPHPTIQSSIFSDLKSSVSGKNLIIDILGKCDFNHPKPVELIKRIITIASKKNSIILDFFAGTGTTGHAVLSQNEDDEGTRTFILCTNNEDNNENGTKIASDICQPRLKKVMEGYVGTVSKEYHEPLGGNMKYFLTDFVDAYPTDHNKKILADVSTEMLCLAEGCYTPVQEGLFYRVFKNSLEKYIGIVYDDEGIDDIKQVIAKRNRKFSIYIFSLDQSAREEDFEDLAHLVELKPIPESILNVYRRLFD